MKPRLTNSKKWTEFPADYVAQIKEVFTQGFEAQLKDCELIVEGRIYAEEILLRVGILEKGRIAQANFEASVNYSASKQDAVDRIYNCIDAAASMMSEYFESEGEAVFPRVWKEYAVENQKLFMQFSTVNSKLEADADALLGAAEDALIHEDQVADALDIADEKIEAEGAETLDEDEEDFGDDDEEEDFEAEAAKGPSMFGTKKPKKKEEYH